MKPNPASPYKATIHPTTPGEISEFSESVVGLEDTTSDDDIGLSPVDKPKSEFVRPPYQFKGAELFPFTYGYELLFNQVRDAEDTGLFTWMAFVYLLRKRDPKETGEEHRDWAIGLAWQVKNFRRALMDWMDAQGPFTLEDKIEAKRIYEENMKAIADAVVEPLPARGHPQKKTRRPKTRSSSTYSETSSDVVVTKSSGG